MPHLAVKGARLSYEERGRGPEPVVFAHGLLMSGRMFDAQVAALEGRYRCVTFDFRGQGGSEVTRGGYDMDTLAEDAAALIAGVHAAPCHFVGLSMGGFVGLRLAIRRPELLRTLTLLGSSAEPEPRENVPKYGVLAAAARWLGLRLVAGRVTPILFGRTFLEDAARAKERARWRERLLRLDRVGIYRAAHGVIQRRGVADQLPGIRTSTLILVGDEDVATVPARSERMHRGIAGSELSVLPGAGHSSTIEQPGAVTAALLRFLDAHPA